VQIVNENGIAVSHTPEFITCTFDEELEKLLRESPIETHETLKKARHLSEEMITLGQFDPI